MYTRLTRPLLRHTRRMAPSRFYATESLDNVYDIVIVGGGVAGTALACSLASHPYLQQHRVALIEAMDLTSTKQWTPQANHYANRTVSLTPGSMRFLENIGVTPFFSAGRANPYREMQVWDGVTDARIHFDAAMVAGASTYSDGMRDATIAYMIENIHLQHALLGRVDECQKQGAQLDLFTNTRVAAIDRPEPAVDNNIATSLDSLDLSDWPLVHLDQGRSLRTRLLIGADGIQSPVRAFAGIDSLGWDYDAHGVVATLQLDGPEHHTAWQRFLPTGPIAMLPMGEGYASMVWSTKPALAKMLKSVSPEDFVQLVNAAFRLNHVDLAYFYQSFQQSGQVLDLAGEVAWRDTVMRNDQKELPPKVVHVQDGSRASFPLRLRNSERYVDDRVALVGDAAHTTHPLAGQGLNQGLLDVEYLTDVLAAGAQDGQDLGSIHLLRNYATERYLKNIVMISACDKMHRLFSNDLAPIAWLRSLGLSTVNGLDVVKSEIMKYAMGIEQPKVRGSNRPSL